jgi:O-antigen chain-terminating methyltransferase
MSAQNDVDELMEHIRLAAADALPHQNGGDAKPAQPASQEMPAAVLDDFPPAPALPSLRPITPPDPVPLAEAAGMVPRAREKLTVRQEVPGILRPMFRNQGGFNGILLETCGRLVEASQQLSRENELLRVRVDSLTDYLRDQGGWLAALGGVANEGRHWMHTAGLRLDLMQQQQAGFEENARIHMERQQEQIERMQAAIEQLQAHGDEHAATLARLETQNENYQTWMQNLQAAADEQAARDEQRSAHDREAAERLNVLDAGIRSLDAGIRDLYRVAEQHAGHFSSADSRMDQMGAHINSLQTQNDRQNEHIQSVHGHMDRLGGHLGFVEETATRTGEHLHSLQHRADEAFALCENARAELEKAAANQRLLEDNDRRLDERQVNDAAYLRAQLAFHQRLIETWLTPAPGALSGGPAHSAPGAIETGSPPQDPAPADDAAAKHKTAAFYDEHRMDALYLAFENTMRGNRDTIKERVRFYIPYLKDSREGGVPGPVLDLGCGRGEWLEVLRDEGITASGVDLNACMIDRCRERGLDVRLGNALDHLASLDDASCGAITAFHLIEHLPIRVLLHFFSECRRVLKPGGLAIFETPNPNNIIVGACTFYHDYTHQRPLPPDSTRFLVEHMGFARAEIVALNPRDAQSMVHGDGTNESLVARFNELFYGPQDYAIVARVFDAAGN